MNESCVIKHILDNPFGLLRYEDKLFIIKNGRPTLSLPELHCMHKTNRKKLTKWALILPRIVNMKVLKKEVLPRYFGPSANLKSHQYSFKFDNLEDSNTESMKNMSIASSRTSMRNRKKRMEFVIDDEDDYNDQRTSKRQKTSRGDDRL